MAESPFAFYRAGARLMAADLAGTPRTDVLVQASGDAHMANFGWYGSPERDLVFDTNDFDETHRAAWEWDVKRLTTSFIIASQDNGLSGKDQRRAARRAVRSYQQAMTRFASEPNLDVWYAHISADDILASLRQDGHTKKLRSTERSFRKASKKTSAHVLGKIGEIVDGQHRIIDDPPFVVPLRSMQFPLDTGHVEGLVHGLFEDYASTVAPGVDVLLSKYRVIDVALKVVGVGSVGTRCYIALLEGNGPQDVLFLQVKQASRSVLEEEFGASRWKHPGQRVVHGQRLMQTSSDILLGWTTSANGHYYYVRQLKDMKASPKIEEFDPHDMERYARVCGVVLAHAHARSTDPAVIAGYLGTNSNFADAVTDFSVTYAEQNEADFRTFVDWLETQGSGAPT